MALKSAILSLLGRDDLCWIVDSLEIDDVDRRNVAGMRATLADDLNLSGEQLLRFLSTDTLRQLARWSNRYGGSGGKQVPAAMTDSD